MNSKFSPRSGKITEVVATALITAIVEPFVLPVLGRCLDWFGQAETVPRWCIALPISLVVAMSIVIIWKRPPPGRRDVDQEDGKPKQISEDRDKSVSRQTNEESGEQTEKPLTRPTDEDSDEKSERLGNGKTTKDWWEMARHIVGL